MPDDLRWAEAMQEALYRDEEARITNDLVLAEAMHDPEYIERLTLVCMLDDLHTYVASELPWWEEVHGFND